MIRQLEHRRIFFALWPDDTTRLIISDAFNLTRCFHETGRNIDAKNLHLTLHFLGNVSQDTFDCVLKAAEQVKFESFRFSLNQYDVFQKAKIFCMGMTDVPVELRALHASLARELQTCGYRPEQRAFTPHVSLKRKVKQIQVSEELTEIDWHVDRFALVESFQVADGVVYKPLKSFFCS